MNGNAGPAVHEAQALNRAQALAGSLPPLLVAAERVAATVAQGLHGRRRVGMGENFWQFRPFVTGDASGRIDWRRSARSGRTFVRDTEWDAAQTVTLWRDAARGMAWRSAPGLPLKSERAGLLLLALASLLLRGGERVRLIEGDQTNAGGSGAGNAVLARMAAALDRAEERGLPRALPPAHGRMILFGDFLGRLDELQGFMGRLAALPVRGDVVQVLDPAEIALPYRGRVRFVGPDGGEALIGRVDGVRAAYQERLRERQAELARLCRGAGFGFLTHATDAAPQAALLTLYQSLARPAGGR